MPISVIKNNSVSYPTEVYYQYNLYLIDEYKLFAERVFKSDISEKARYSNIEYSHKAIDDLENILEENISSDIENVFSVMDWEEKLQNHYSKLNDFYKRSNNFNQYSLNSINAFLRKEKLKNLNEKSLEV